MTTPRRARGEHGVSLILALAFMAFFGLIVSAVLVSAQSGLKTTPVVSDKDAKLYAADGGIDYGIQTVRDSGELCQHTQDPPTTESVGTVTINSQPVAVSCSTLSGDGTGGGGAGGGGPIWVGQYGGPDGWSAVATRYGTPQWGTTRRRCNSENTNITTTTGPSTPVTTNDGVTYANTATTKRTVTSDTAGFVATDVGLTITGVKGTTQMWPTNAKIAAVVSPTQITLDKDVAAAGFNQTGITIAFTRPGVVTTTTSEAGITLTWCDANPSTGQTVTFGGTEVFTAGAVDVPPPATNVNVQFSGNVQQVDKPPNNYCTTRDQAALGPTAGSWTCVPADTAAPDPQPSVVVPSAKAGATTSGTCSTSTRPAVSDGVTYAAPNRRKVTSATANFTAADVGQQINGVKGTGPGSKIIDKATIVSVQSATEITISKDTTKDVTGVTLTIGASTTHTVTYYYPGMYSPGNGNVPSFDGDYIYFASGVYYFEDVGYVPVKGNGAWGGALSNEQFVSPGGDCNQAMTDDAARALCATCLPANPGKGVTFIFGGQSLFDIHAPITELNRRVAGDQEASCPGGANNCGAVTIFAWASDTRPTSTTSGQPIITGAYKTFNPGLGLDRCNCAFVTDKSGQQIIFHGLTYAPYSPVDVFSNAGGPDGLDYSPFFGGVVASQIVARVDSGSLGTSLFAGGFGPNTGPTMRTIRITATTGTGQNGSRSITSTAIIEIDPDAPANTTRVKSWRNQ